MSISHRFDVVGAKCLSWVMRLCGVNSRRAPSTPLHASRSMLQNADELIRRRADLEKRLASDTTLTDDRKSRQLAQLGRTESSFLRLRRTRLGLDDFRTVKVIGKGAFGEVSFASFSVRVVLTRRESGAIGTEGRYRQDLCDEEFEEIRDV